MFTAKTALLGLAGAFAVGAAVFPALTRTHAAGIELPAVASDEQALEHLRHTGDVTAQRRHAWGLFAEFTKPVMSDGTAKPRFETWHGEGELFGKPAPIHPASGIEGFYRTDDGTASLDPAPDVPVLTYTLYNDPAYRHIVDNRLNEASTLGTLLKSGPVDSVVGGDRSVPQFPTTAAVMKTVWWPVARSGVTALPVWDPVDNPPLGHGNPYTTWQRVVGVDPSGAKASTVTVDFAGTRYPAAHRIPLAALYHVPVDADMARRMMVDAPTAKAMLIALGRPIQAGDYLALVGVNMASREIPEWIWVTLWWHDQPDQGPFAAGRPAALAGAWQHYLMQTAFDPVVPAAPDGAAHIAFNPWLEGRFPDGGHGGGVQSNCMACHARASYPNIMFLPVTRGAPDTESDPAFAPGRLRTSLLWSLAMHAKS